MAIVWGDSEAMVNYKEESIHERRRCSLFNFMKKLKLLEKEEEDTKDIKDDGDDGKEEVGSFNKKLILDQFSK